MLSTIPQWVAIYTLSRAEKQVNERLSDRGIESYLPLIDVKRKWSDRYKMVTVPLFSSYVFAKINIYQPAIVRSIPGVCYIVSIRNVIETLSDEEIEGIRRFVSSKQAVYVEATQALRKGRMVRILDGHFAGMVGELLDDSREGNFAIRIKALNVSVLTHIDRVSLEPLRNSSGK